MDNVQIAIESSEEDWSFKAGLYRTWGPQGANAPKSCF